MGSHQNLRNKDVTEHDLSELLNALHELEAQLIQEVDIFLRIGGDKPKLYSMDYFISAIINRSISLISGFHTLATASNYIAAVPIIRMQLDNVLRLFAATIVPDRDEFFYRYLNGEHIRNMEDVNGKKMTDAYLARKVDSELYPGLLNLYNNTSGYIHFSKVHSFLQTKIIDEKQRAIRTYIGRHDFWDTDEKVDFTFNMFKTTEILYRLVHGWTIFKSELQEPKGDVSSR